MVTRAYASLYHTPKPNPLLRVTGAYAYFRPTPKSHHLLRIIGSYAYLSPTPKPHPLLRITGAYVYLSPIPKPLPLLRETWNLPMLPTPCTYLKVHLWGCRKNEWMLQKLKKPWNLWNQVCNSLTALPYPLYSNILTFKQYLPINVIVSYNNRILNIIL